MAKSPRILPPNLEPFFVDRTEAAGLFGVSVSLFDCLVEEKKVPRPVRIHTRTLWDVSGLRKAAIRLAGANSAELEDDAANPWDKATRR